MSTTIDQRVVEMRFDNQHFEKNVSNTMSTLDKLKQSLKFSGASKGLEDVNAAAKKVDMGALTNSVNAVGSSFSALQVMAVTALANITNSAVNAGKNIVSALTIQPVMTGFQEYETQINAIQTILANTSHAGTDLNDVNNALDTLNTYADKTIYNFTEMTRNIGTFTAAGVDLDTSVNAIKGIANLAAVSGSTSQQASTAMYQLSQALAAGTVKLQDWNSVVNAGMGGKVFQDALTRTAAVMAGSAKNVEGWRKANIDSYGSFRDSLTEGAWLTTEVLTETLAQFTGDMTDAELKAKGYTDQQIADIQKMAVTANDAATKVKTFTQLWDTLKEAAQSGWTQTWEIIVGDFEEAKSLLTSISDVLNEMIGKSAEARNSLLSEALGKTDVTSYISDLTGATSESVAELKALGEQTGYTSDEFKELASSLAKGDEGMQTTITNLLKMSAGEQDVISYISEMTGMTERSVKELHRLGQKTGYTSDEFKEFALTLAEGDEAMAMSITNLLKMSDEMNKLSGREALIASFKNIFEALLRVVKPVKEAFSDIFPAVTADQIYNAVLAFKDFTENLKIGAKTANDIKRTFKGLFSILDLGRKIIVSVTKPLLDLLGSDGIASVGALLLDAAAALGDFFTSMNKGFDASGITGLFSSIVSGISSFLGIATDKIRGFGDIFAFVGGVVTDVAGSIWNALQKVFGWISENISLGDVFAGLAGGGIFVLAKKLADLIGKVKETFENFFGGGDGKKGGFLSDIGEKFTDVMDSVHGALESFTVGIKATTLVSIAVAIGILSASLKSIATLSIPDITKSLFAIGTLLTMLSIGFSSITKSLTKFDSKGIVKSGIALVLMATAINILADAMAEIGKLSLPEIGKGLLGIGASLVGLCAAIKVIGGIKIPLRTSVAILALAYSCKILGDALGTFSKMSWDEIARGLSAMGGALAELVASVSILGKFGGFKSLFGSLGTLIVVQSLEKMAEGLKSFAQMSWDEIKRGLTAMGGALAELGVTLGALGKVAGFSSIFAAGAIWIVTKGLDDLASALSKFSTLSWDEIKTGLTAMGGALAELGVTLGALGKIAGFSSIFAAGAIWIVIQGLDELYSALSNFATMSWDEIGRGLTAMGGALLEVGVVAGALGMLAGFSSIFGAGAIWITIQGLTDLAVSLKKFGEMSWDEIGRGLVAMGGALLEVGVISGAMGYLTGLAGIFGAGAIWVAVQGLDDLATSLKKFGEMNWDEIGRGLAAMGGALGELAIGGFLNTFALIGSYSIENIAEPLGVLADSVKKWVGVEVPEGLGWQLSSLAGGILAFTFGGMGALTLSVAAEPLGILADSVKKWTNVTVPEGLGDKLSLLADGIKSFSWAFMGGLSISASAGPLGTLADSVSKWRNVTVPDDIESKLTSLANGVKAFSWAFMGGMSISTVVEPLSTLADSVKKWRNVTVPDTLGEDLESLADGVKSFTWAFVGGWSINTVAEPLGTLADAIKKLSGITFPEDIGTNLTSVANGIKSYSGIPDLTNTTIAISSIVSSVQKFSGLDYGYVCSGIRSLANSLTYLGQTNVTGFVNAFTNSVSSVTTAVSNMMNAISNTINSKRSSITSSFTNLIQGLLTSVNGKQQSFNLAGQNIVTNFITGINSKATTLSTTMVQTVNMVLTKIRDKYPEFETVGKNMMVKLIAGIKSKSESLSTAFTSILNSALTSIRGYYDDFYSAGGYLVEGFATGIDENTWRAEAEAAAMARAALDAAKDELDINSPSKVFRDEVGLGVPEGTAVGIKENAYMATTAAVKMAKEVVETTIRSFDEDALKNEIANKVGSGITNGIYKAKDTVKGTVAQFAQSVKWIESNTKSGELNLIGQLSAWKRVQARYLEGTKQRIEADKKVLALQGDLRQANEDYYNNIISVQESANEKRKQLDQDYYSSVQRINDQLEADIKSLENEYENALKSRTDALYNSYKLFDKVDGGKYVSKYALMENLEDQIKSFEKWISDLDTLSSRGVDSELVKELQEMGISSAAEIKALTTMTDDELTKYQDLWKQKHTLASERATLELTDMYNETQTKIAELRANAETELAELRETWLENIELLNEETQAKLDELKDAWLEKVLGITKDSESEFSKMMTELVNIIGNESGWSESGANIIEGVLEGIVDHSSTLNSEIANVMKTALETAKGVLGIHSPSREFADLGMYADQGFARGLLDFTGVVVAAAKNVGTVAMDAMVKSIDAGLALFSQDNIGSKYFEFYNSGNGLMAQFVAGIVSTEFNVSAAMNQIVARILTIIQDRHREFEIVGAMIMTKLISGIRSKIESIIQTFTSILNTSLTTIRNYYGAFYDAGYSLGEGMAAGIEASIALIVAAAEEAASAALGAMRVSLDINSPSKEFAKLGMYSDMGFAQGLTKYARLITHSASKVGNAAIDSLRNTISNLSTMVEDNVDTQPTIRPVLDLTNVEAGTNRLSALFSRSQALSISAGMNRKYDEGIQNGDNTPNAGNTTYTFTQNNYSPKALSRAEIYRQTKNQFSAMKGLVKS